MKHTLSPLISDLQSESVLFQAWKKTEAYIRSHNWYADTLELDWQALRLPEFIAGIQTRIGTGKWRMKPLRMVPAPKSQRWETDAKGKWQPADSKPLKIRPLAHVDLEDQVICTAVMLCLADRVENLQSDPTGGDKTLEDRKRLLSYGHRLFCRMESGKLRHAWAAKKLYRLYSTDYRRFLARPEDVAKEQRPKLEADQHVAIVTADLSRFYDRVRPDLLRKRILELKQHSEEQSFFDFVGQLFDWEWDTGDKQRAGAYAEDAKPKIDGFDHIALPQGLVAAGFFANLALLSFDSSLSDLLGKPIAEARGVTLLDACRYVDDMRLVLRVPKTINIKDLEIEITNWLNARVQVTATGLWVERDKTHVVIQGEQDKFTVHQSRAAERIQHEISGGFDMEQGMNIIMALEGFIHAQHQYSPDAAETQNGLAMAMKGISDMRDDTAARFFAFRYRSTFRSLRPLLDSELPPKDDETDQSDEDEIEAALPTPDSIVSREQFDERGLLFASSQIAAWESNPAQVRLMRIAVDLFPRAEFCTRILKRLRPAWTKLVTDPRRREALLYCLAELFRAGATETGIVFDHDELPDNATGTDVSAYHETLLNEGREIIRAAAQSGKKSNCFPWYLLQQVMLYLATRQESLEDVDLSKLPGAGGVLRRYVEMYQFYTESYQPTDAADKARFMIMQARSFDQQAEMISRAAKHPTTELLRSLASISPSFADRVWRQMKPLKQRSLSSVAQAIGLASALIQPKENLTSAADLSGLQQMIWQEEYNLVVLACELMTARQKKRDGVLTPWRIFCQMESITQGPVSQRIVPDTVQIHAREGGETLFVLPDWCETDDERIRVEVGQVLRYLLTGSVEYFRSLPRAYTKKNLPQYRRALSSWELGRYGSFNGRVAFGPDWLPLSAWAESLLIGLLRWPGCGTREEAERTTAQWITHLKARIKDLNRMRGEATGILFLDQEARLPRRPPAKWERPLRIAIVQTVVPDSQDFVTAGIDDLQLNGAAIRQKHRRHLRLMLQGVRKMLDARLSHSRENTNANLDWLILPELAVHPDDVVPLLRPVVCRYKCIVLAGLVYHPKDASDLESKLINSALWLIPEWSPEHGLQVSRIEQGKALLAPGVEDSIHALTGYRPAQWIVRYHWSSNPLNRPLLLSAAVCYDATDTGLAHDLRNRNDFFAICALNKDITTYDNIAATLNYHLFQGVLVVNNGQFGGSNFHAPLKERHERKIIHFHGQPQATIGFAEISPRKFTTRPAQRYKAQSPVGEWKTPPAGWLGP